MSPREGQDEPNRVWVAAAVLFLATLCAYLPVLQNEFVSFDDPGYLENRHVREGFSADGIVWAFTKEHSSNWHPLTWMSHMLDVQLFGMHAGAHHFESVVLHALAAICLLVFLHRTTGSVWGSALVAGLFALHPLRVESVAWASERKDVLSGLFFFLSLVLYASYARRPNAVRYIALCLCFALGLLAKPMLVTLPAVLLLVDLWPLRREGISKLVLEKIPILALSIGSCIATVWAQDAGGAIKDFDSLALSARIANAFESVWLYLGKSLWPADLAVFYPHPALVHADHQPWRWQALLGVVFVIVVTLGCLRQLRQRPWLTAGWFWYLGMLVPVIGILQVGGQRIADRYTYLPLVGITFALVFEIRPRLSDSLRKPARIAGASILVLLGVLTWRQATVWRDTETLFLHTLAVTERNYVAHNNLALEYMQSGRADQAIEHLEARLAISPATGAYINLGTIYAQRGETDKAITTFEKALTRKADQADALANLGALYLSKGDEPRARKYLEQALQTKRAPITACERLAWMLVTTRQPNGRDAARALRLIEKSLKRQGAGTWSFQRTLAAVRAANGDFEGAVKAIRKATRGAPPPVRAQVDKERELYLSGRTL